MTLLSAALCVLQPVTPCAASGAVASCGAALATAALILGSVAHRRAATVSTKATVFASALALMLNLMVVH
jgi:cation transporter-like permease